MSYLIADLVYLLAVLGYLSAFFLALEWLVHALPGSWLNPARRGLFQFFFPLLKWCDSFMPVKWGRFDSRGLLAAVLLMLISRYGVPWLVLFSYSLR